MIMTREELINTPEYRFESTKIEKMNELYPIGDFMREREAFIRGCEWAEEELEKNPKWHKYPDEKPSKTDEYIVAFNNGNVYTAHYTQHRDKWHDRDIANNCNTSKVIAWMEFPKPPKFD